MPEFLQGDIFQVAIEGGYDLAIVFGHVGFNEMSLAWRRFCERPPALTPVADPFSEYARQPQRLRECWFWFVPDDANRGMTDDQVESELRDAVWWAMKHFKRPVNIITNGIAETASAANRERRVRFLAELAACLEGCRFRVGLVSLNDVFVHSELP